MSSKYAPSTPVLRLLMDTPPAGPNVVDAVLCYQDALETFESTRHAHRLDHMAAAKGVLEYVDSVFYESLQNLGRTLSSQHRSSERRMVNSVGTQDAVGWRAGREAKRLLTNLGSLKSAREYVQSNDFWAQDVPDVPVAELTWNAIEKDARMIGRRGAGYTMQEVLRGARGDFVLALMAAAAQDSTSPRARAQVDAAISLTRVDRQLTLSEPRGQEHVADRIDDLAAVFATFPSVVEAIASSDLLESLRSSSRAYSPMVDAIVRPLALALAGPTADAEAQTKFRQAFEKGVTTIHLPTSVTGELFNAATLVGAQPGSATVSSAFLSASNSGRLLVDPKRWQGKDGVALNEHWIRAAAHELCKMPEFAEAFGPALGGALVATEGQPRFRSDHVAVQTAAASLFGAYGVVVRHACNVYEEETFLQRPDLMVNWSDFGIDGLTAEGLS